jgi:hypothetical protein
MEYLMIEVEAFWEEILSEQPDRIIAAYLLLPRPDEQAAVLRHVQAMASEDGWSEPQRTAAAVALQTILDLENTRKK